MTKLPRRTQIKDDRELEREANITPADHVFVTPAYIRALERKILGPSWGKKRRKLGR